MKLRQALHAAISSLQPVQEFGTVHAIMADLTKELPFVAWRVAGGRIEATNCPGEQTRRLEVVIEAWSRDACAAGGVIDDICLALPIALTVENFRFDFYAANMLADTYIEAPEEAFGVAIRLEGTWQQ